MQIRYLISRIWKDQPLRFSLSVVALTVAGLLEGIGVAAIVPMLQIIQTGNSAASSVGRFGQAIFAILGFFHLPFNLSSVLGFILVIILASEGATLLQQKVLAGSTALFEATLRKKLFAAVFDAGWSFFLRTKANDIMSALMNDTSRANQAYNYLAQVIGAIVMVVVYLVLAIALSWQMTLAIIIVSVIVVSLLRNRANRGTKFGQDITRVDAEIQSATAENLNAAKLVKASAVETVVRQRFKGLTEVRQRIQYRNQMNQAWLKTLYDSAAIVTVFVGIYAAVSFFGMSIASLTVFLFAYYRLSPRISNLQSNQSLILSLVPGLQRVDDFTTAAAALHERSGGAPLKEFSEAIRLVDVSFAYDAEHAVLHHIDMTIPHAQSTAIVGPSGAGKTTVMDLIMGLLLPESGDILVDGASLKDIHLADWRRQIGYVPQDASFFHATVAENIAWGFEGASRDEVVEAAKLADADEFILCLPDGYDTIIGDRGVRLSGGQRQRLALARAIVRKPSILVLDEATSALDAESEAKVQHAVDRLTGSLTVLIVTHRLATVTGCNLIYVLDAGTLVESGTWDELLARKGQFAELVERQALTRD
jgi:ABC-type multidrug transport system fused ATPase/permease subunit